MMLEQETEEFICRFLAAKLLQKYCICATPPTL